MGRSEYKDRESGLFHIVIIQLGEKDTGSFIVFSIAAQMKLKIMEITSICM